MECSGRAGVRPLCQSSPAGALFGQDRSEQLEQGNSGEEAVEVAELEPRLETLQQEGLIITDI